MALGWKALLAVSALTGLAIAGPGADTRADATASDIPQSKTAVPVPTVGALFSPGSGGTHGCTATVLSSPGFDLAITAAHCLHGTGSGWRLVPGYDRGAAPYGVWQVSAAYVPAAWQARQDPHADYAILRLVKQKRHGHLVGIQQVTGGVQLGIEQPVGTPVTVTAYNAGSGDRPIKCTVRLERQAGYPRFTCGGYIGGSSGSAFISGTGAKRRIGGVIGGLHQGGCVDYQSYSSPFGSGPGQLLQRAEKHQRADNVVPAGSDGC